MTIGEIIQRERTRLGLSQEKLAEQVGVSRQAVSKWELGTQYPTQTSWSLWCGVLLSLWERTADVRFPSPL